ncbi:ASKHA domain-containing protein [uncultured Cohaesibacter sp.]|uniref:ASKHA domain-containing protein n=1 Tax=uncultured Cohaesibacter sp. TaxID=1002546 RepID=UPI0029C9381F|nr:ASKHA domain-containing protein [uncultured Cohaesibacter sp.]
MVSVNFHPSGTVIDAEGGALLLDVARRAGVRVEAACAGRGICKSCIVRLESATGAIPAPSDADLERFTASEIENGWRRACQVLIFDPLDIHVPAKSYAANVALGQDGGNTETEIRQPVAQPTGEDRIWQIGDGACVGPLDGAPLALTVDLGTTNIAAALVDMVTGKLLKTSAATNPQTAFGADVISRLGAAKNSLENAATLKAAALDTIRHLAHRMTGGNNRMIALVSLAGNTAMQHLAMGWPIKTLLSAPYTPSVTEPFEADAADFGLDLAQGARIYVAPSIAGFVGGDHVTSLYETSLSAKADCWAMLDIGTNTEIGLFKDGHLTSVSCASGPAFEGGRLSCGMRAAPGAVEAVAIVGNKVSLKIIGNKEPVGICGSGVVSAVAALVNAGLVNRRGRMQPCAPIEVRGKQRELVLWRDPAHKALPVLFTQDDLRNVQLAKAAIRAGLDCLLGHAGLHESDLEQLVIAGAFGRYIDIDEAVRIGLFPDLPKARISQVGNAAAAGVRRLSVCIKARQEAEALARSVSYLELASDPDFQRAFITRSGL